MLTLHYIESQSDLFVKIYYCGHCTIKLFCDAIPFPQWQVYSPTGRLLGITNISGFDNAISICKGFIKDYLNLWHKE